MTFFVGSDSLTKSEFSGKLKTALKVEMPDDFYDFYDFCKELNPTSVTGKNLYAPDHKLFSCPFL